MSRTSVPAVSDVATGAVGAIDTLVDAAPSSLAIPLADLQIAPNVRVTPSVHKRLIESIKTHGVLTPVIVRESVLGGFEVIDGQRRTLAAREAGLTKIPAVVTHAINDDTDRIVSQIVINDERESVSTWETAQGFKQLTLMGMSLTAVSKKTGYSKEVVKAGLEVTKERKNEFLFAGDQNLDLIQAAAIAPFAQNETATTDLLSAVGTPRFEHVLARLTKNKEREERIAAESETYLEQGYLLYTWDNSKGAENIYNLSNVAEGPAISADEHAQCPGRMVKVDVLWDDTVRVTHMCATWKTSGHYNRYAANTSGATSGEQSEEKKAERRHTIEMNRNAEAAMEVHEKWLHEFFARPAKAIPAGLEMAAFRILTALSAASYSDLWVSDTRKFKADSPTDARTASRFYFALAISTVTRHYKREYWRDEHMQRYVIPFLREIAALGYPLADFEAELLDEAPGDE